MHGPTGSGRIRVQKQPGNYHVPFQSMASDRRLPDSFFEADATLVLWPRDRKQFTVTLGTPGSHLKPAQSYVSGRLLKEESKVGPSSPGTKSGWLMTTASNPQKDSRESPGSGFRLLVLPFWKPTTSP